MAGVAALWPDTAKEPTMTAKTALSCAFALTSLLALTACFEKGPAERAGERIDRAGEQVRDAVDPPRGPAERAGRAIDRATD